MTNLHESRQVIGEGRAHYELVDPPFVEPGLCRSCGADIVRTDGDVWVRVEASWPNLAHCHYSARDGSSQPHAPVED